ncbi:hypothetical protein GE061_009756 [Apolygus lucorum]|uniref:HTH CENPB-type domain-containing protein n=1 Tax=Apolygus lucorum TaxID=248454 RepID=A0A8S9Y353_APOLU|nr:hypothetical protein GE061_009756 [Apolygus lucorum]
MARKMGPATILTQQEEDQIEEWIVKKAMLGFPLHPEDVKDSIQGLLTESPRENPFTNNRPGIKWFNLFLKRHPEIKKRNTEVIPKDRAEVTKENLEECFNELNNFLIEHDCVGIFEGSTRGRRVLNLDETGCLTCPKTGKVLGPKQLPDFYEVTTGSEKQSITVLCTYSADGSALPPMVVKMGKRYFCDYCQRSFVDDIESRKKHLFGVSHLRMKKEYYAMIRDLKTLVQEERSKELCRRFRNTGECSFGVLCNHTHYSPEELAHFEATVKLQEEERSKLPKIEEWIARKAELDKKIPVDAHVNRLTTLLDPSLPPSLRLPSWSDISSTSLLEWG